MIPKYLLKLSNEVDLLRYLTYLTRLAGIAVLLSSKRCLFFSFMKLPSCL